ncbi:hypothetical protein [Humibacter ginsenosidimutans]|uniref:Uncharacterized protein n=1 Tax=Humibacter ginsenosidimutans TaxID=2599293 RepID=A0A5B8M050_9MICO|nr:hypothetical protein [Humibacter ginsenosidimutans]QDZ13636.1 hypothetical protein FPZ11_01430 [Humibacter ginsenosidimutans]
MTVSTTGADSRRLVSERVALKDDVAHGPCGDLHFWGANARVSAGGHVEMLGWSGAYLPPATSTPEPTPSSTT